LTIIEKEWIMAAKKSSKSSKKLGSSKTLSTVLNLKKK